MKGIYRCEDGHLFTRSVMSMLLEANLGPGRHYARCPVDGRRGLIVRVDEHELTADQIEAARAVGRR